MKTMQQKVHTMMLIIYPLHLCDVRRCLFIFCILQLSLDVSTLSHPSPSRSSDGNSSLLDEGGSASQVPQASVELAGYGCVV